MIDAGALARLTHHRKAYRGLLASASPGAAMLHLWGETADPTYRWWVAMYARFGGTPPEQPESVVKRSAYWWDPEAATGATA